MHVSHNTELIAFEKIVHALVIVIFFFFVSFYPHHLLSFIVDKCDRIIHFHTCFIVCRAMFAHFDFYTSTYPRTTDTYTPINRSVTVTIRFKCAQLKYLVSKRLICLQKIKTNDTCVYRSTIECDEMCVDVADGQQSHILFVIYSLVFGHLYLYILWIWNSNRSNHNRIKNSTNIKQPNKQKRNREEKNKQNKRQTSIAFNR